MPAIVTQHNRSDRDGITGQTVDATRHRAHQPRPRERQGVSQTDGAERGARTAAEISAGFRALHPRPVGPRVAVHDDHAGARGEPRIRRALHRGGRHPGRHRRMWRRRRRQHDGRRVDLARTRQPRTPHLPLRHLPRHGDADGRGCQRVRQTGEAQIRAQDEGRPVHLAQLPAAGRPPQPRAHRLPGRPPAVHRRLRAGHAAVERLRAHFAAAPGHKPVRVHQGRDGISLAEARHRRCLSD